ncbi:hypothetical protein K505DRAFT_417142 [Melanomma pulvis-pyrius CBS 109.77]|uniref:AB hydrolase-1 domain-containing protein n=1 Tax=Melanomma pulvis-pyrius CBS 109.77 TaxID=1314802 RepID=A0A6A6XD79_9PLEO|nr:hypothetical protein K505DRAFT_417142 [Melanomma pulvis-pyrius CBS 109.77]
MAEPKLTILFVHGAWHTPAHFTPVRSVFENAEYPTSCPLLPTAGKQAPTDMGEDARFIREEQHKLIEEEGKNVVVVAHSNGGIITAQAVEQRFAKRRDASFSASGWGWRV